PARAPALRDRLRGRPLGRRFAGRAEGPQGRGTGAEGAAPRGPERTERGGAHRGQGRARAMDRHPRRRWPERPCRHPEAGRSARSRRSAGEAVRRPAGGPPGLRFQALGQPLGQPHPLTPAARRDPGYRLRHQAVRTRGVPRPALPRPPAPLPASAGPARGLEDGERAGRAPRPHLGGVQVQQPGPGTGGHPRPARGGLADRPQPPYPRGGVLMLDQPLEWLYWTGLHVTGWKLIGYTGALMFGARWLVQFVASRRAGRPVIPRLFWYMSVAGSLM